MPTNRTPISRPSKGKITPQIVALYRAAITVSEDDYNEASLALHIALGRQPWQVMVTDTMGNDGSPPQFIWQHGSDKVTDWLEARALRRKLEADPLRSQLPS